MTTLLEHRFDFTADDLAANQRGELSEKQQDRQIFYRKLRCMARGSFSFGAVIASLYMFATFGLPILRGQEIDLGLHIMVFAGALMIIWPSLFIKPFRQLTFDTRTGTLQHIPMVRRDDFTLSSHDSVRHYVLAHNSNVVRINQRQWNVIDSTSALDIYFPKRV